MSRKLEGPGQDLMQDELDANSTLGQILLLKDETPNATFFVVEGYRDSIIFENYIKGGFIRKENCQIVIADGDVLNELIKKTEFSKGKSFAISDADCSHLNGVKIQYNNLFFTDNRDMESDIICSESFEKFLNSINIQDVSHLRKKLQKNCKNLGLLRCISEKKKWGIDFSCIVTDYSFQDYYDNKKESLDFEGIVSELAKNEKNLDLIILKNYSNLEQELIKTYKDHDYAKICQGHDLVRLLYQILKGRLRENFVIKTKYGEPSMRDFEQLFYISYSFEDFKKTKLYCEIIQWEKKKGYDSIFQTLSINN